MFSALIIDADSEAAGSIQGALNGLGFDFTSTKDAPEAMTLAKSNTPDIIFLRVELPNVSGFSVCNKLRRSADTKTIPLVMYASGVSEDVFNQHRNLKTHADEYLKLPFNGDSLVHAVRSLIPLKETTPSTSQTSTVLTEDEDDLNVEIDDLLAEEPELSANGQSSPSEVHEDELDDLQVEVDAIDMAEFEREFEEMSVHDSDGQPQQAQAFDAETEAALEGLLEDSPVESSEPAQVNGHASTPPQEEEVVAVPPAKQRLLEPAVSVQLGASSAPAAVPSAVVPTPPPEPTEPEAAAAPEPLSEPAQTSDSEPDVRSVDQPAATVTAKSAIPEPIRDDVSHSGGSAGFKAQREVIALKGQLNAKNREILALRDDIEARERAVLDAKHRNRDLLTQISELEEKLLLAEERTINATEQAEALHQDKATALKREEGLKARLEQSQRKHKELETAHEQREREAKETLERLQALEQSLQTVQQAKKSLETENEQTSARLATSERERQEAAERADSLNRAKSELEAELERTKAAAEEQLAQSLERAASDHQQALATAQKEHQAELEFEENQHRDALNRLTSELESKQTELVRAHSELEARQKQLEALQTSSQSEIAETQSKLAQAEAQTTELTAAMKSQQVALESQNAQLVAKVDNAEQELEQLRKELAQRRDAEKRAQQAIAVALRVLDGQIPS